MPPIRLLLSLCLLFGLSSHSHAQFHTLGGSNRSTPVTKDSVRRGVPERVGDPCLSDPSDTGAGFPTYSGLSLPLSSIVVTSPRGYRYHPVHGAYAWHAGVDLRAYYEPVYSVMDGWVEQTGMDEIAGYWIRLRHSGEMRSSYAHLYRIEVDPGKTVQAGQRIAVSGNSGRSTGPHLHFRIIRERNTSPDTTLKR